MSGTLFQASPGVWFDFWRSPDGITLGNVLLMAGYGRVSLHSERTLASPGFSDHSEDTDSGNVRGFGAGVGGDHFLSPNFSIGVEGASRAP
jgi:hypothetical protein